MNSGGNASVVLVEVEPPIGFLIINRPEQRNAMSLAVWDGLIRGVEALDKDRDVRVIVIRGSGDRVFGAGADIRELDEVRRDPVRINQALEMVERTMLAVERTDKPVIAMVNGAAMGGGCELAAACDLRLASDTARFGIPAGNLGIVITFQDTRRLIRLVGLGMAKEILMTGRTLDAQEAQQIGLVNRVVPAENLLEETVALAKLIADKAPLTVTGAKRIANRIAEGEGIVSIFDGLEPARKAWNSADFAEGVRAYLEKRPPIFRGE
jgi:enoyl-CoA hydratase/carnithine racemase